MIIHSSLSAVSETGSGPIAYFGRDDSLKRASQRATPTCRTHARYGRPDHGIPGVVVVDVDLVAASRVVFGIDWPRRGSGSIERAVVNTVMQWTIEFGVERVLVASLEHNTSSAHRPFHQWVSSLSKGIWYDHALNDLPAPSIASILLPATITPSSAAEMINDWRSRSSAD